MSSVKRRGRGAPDEAELSNMEKADTGVCDAISQREASVDDRLRSNTRHFGHLNRFSYLLS